MTLQQFFEQTYQPLRLLGKSKRTVTLYEYSIRLFEETLGRPAELSDFTDVAIAKHLQRLLDQQRSPHGVNKERAQLCAMWNFAAKKRLVEAFPTVPTITDATLKGTRSSERMQRHGKRQRCLQRFSSQELGFGPKLWYPSAWGCAKGAGKRECCAIAVVPERSHKS